MDEQKMFSKDECKALSAQLTEARAREEKLLEELMAWTDRIIERDKKYAKLQQEFDRLRHTQSSRQAEIDSLSRKLRESQDMLARAVDEVHHLYLTSTSWKFSAPVRFFGRLVRRPR